MWIMYDNPYRAEGVQPDDQPIGRSIEPRSRGWVRLIIATPFSVAALATIPLFMGGEPTALGICACLIAFPSLVLLGGWVARRLVPDPIAR